MLNEGHSRFADLLKNSDGNLYSLLSLFKETLIFLFDSEGRFTFGHTDSESRLHAPPGVFMGKLVREVLPLHVSDQFSSAFDKNRNGEVAEFCYWLDMKTHMGWYKATCSPIIRKGVFDGSLAVVKDITQENESAEALARSEENYRTLVEMASMGIVIITDGIVVFSNPVTSEISGYTRNEVTGRSFVDFIAPNDRARVAKLHQDRLAGGEAPGVYQTGLIRKNGSIIDTEISIRLVEYQGKMSALVLMQDISLRKQAERELLTIQDTLKERVSERTAELENYRAHLEDIVEARTSRLRNTISLLRKEIEERILAEERAEHLKLILRAIRSINQVITTETDAQSLIDGACMNLVETRGYKDAWIFLVNQDGSYMTASEARYGEDLEPLKSKLMQGIYTPCLRKSLDSDDPWVSDEARSICFECTLVQNSKEPRHIMACRLQCHNRIYGTLTVTSLGTLPPDHEEVALFREVCDDIAFALDSIEQERAGQKTARALEESEDRYKALFENSGMAILFMQEEMILDCNTKAAAVFQCAKRDLIGLRPYDLSPLTQPDGRLSAEKAMEKIKAAISNKPQYFKWIHSKMNGEEFPAEVSLNAVEIAGKNYIQAIVNDITKKEKAETALRESEKNYRTLSNNVPVGVFRSAPSGRGTLISVNPTMVAMFGYNSIESLLEQNSEILFGDACNRELFLEKLEECGVVENYETQMKKADGSTFWASISARCFNPDGDDANSFLIDGIISDISQSKSYADNLQNSLESLRKTIDGTVSAMSFLVEMKDPYTSGHQKGVSLLACAIAREMGLDEETIHCIRIAGSLHDLGKLNVPLEVLSKPGVLNDFEIDFLKTHPRAGYDILKSIEFPWPIAEVVLQHHERQDGSGYPRGLKGDEVRVEARIIAVADVVEATASRRPYRASRGINIALEAVREGSGTVYDKEVVDNCLKLFLEKGFTLIDHDGETIRADITF